MNHDPNLRAGDWHEDTYSNPGVMTNRWWIGVAVVIVVIATAIGIGAWMSNPANDPTAAESAFLDTLDEYGIDYGTDAQGVELVRAACDLYAVQGAESAPSVIDLFDEAGFDIGEMAVASIAVVDAC